MSLTPGARTRDLHDRLSPDATKVPATTLGAIKGTLDVSFGPMIPLLGLAGPFRASTVPERDYLALKVPKARKYQLVYELDWAKLGRDITYDVDNHAKITGPFDRVAYFLQLEKAGEPVRYLHVSMDAFTDDVTRIGIPTLASKAHFQARVTNMNVISNAPGIAMGTGLNGNIES